MDLKNVLNESEQEESKSIRKHKKPVQLRDIESRSANKRTDNIESDESISKMLDVEKGVSLKKPWNKLDTGLKLNRLKVFIENEIPLNSGTYLQIPP